MEVPGGVLPNSKILSFRIFEDSDRSAVSMKKLKTALFKIRVHYKHIKAINLSIWMLDEPDWDLLNEFQKLDDLGVVICACAGNKFSDPADPANLLLDSSYRVLYPARLGSLVSVGAVAKDLNRDSFSRFSTRAVRGYDGTVTIPSGRVDFPSSTLWHRACMIYWGERCLASTTTTWSRKLHPTSLRTATDRTLRGSAERQWQRPW